MYCGRSFRKNTANKNIKNGPTIQVINNETSTNLGFRNIVGILEKSILVNGGYIINIKPIANGRLVVPDENEVINPAVFGIKYPIPTPSSIARKIQSVKKRSKNESLFLMGKSD